MSDRIPHDYKPVLAGSYDRHRQLLALGAIFEWCTRLWWVPPDKLREAEELVEEARRGRR